MNPEKSEFVNGRIANARKTLEEVDILIENKLWNNAINRLYYACFYAVTALLANNDIDTKTHSGAQRMFGLHFIKSGGLNEEYGGLYASLMGMRQKADYEDAVEYEKEDVLKLLGPAHEMISDIEVILSKP